jgi:hypothetical protein
MPSTLWSAPVGPLNSTSGTAVTGGTSLTDSSPTPPIIVPAGIVSVGTEIRLRAHGEYTTTSVTPTLTFTIVWNNPGTAIASGVVVAASAAITLTSASATGWPWMLEWDGEFRALSTVAGGSTGSVNGQGKIHVGTALTTFGSPFAFPATKALRTVSIDTSISKAVQLGITWSSATGTPSGTCDDLIVELLG